MNHENVIMITLSGYDDNVIMLSKIHVIIFSFLKTSYTVF
jgi:hypothetical protein